MVDLLTLRRGMGYWPVFERKAIHTMALIASPMGSGVGANSGAGRDPSSQTERAFTGLALDKRLGVATLGMTNGA